MTYKQLILKVLSDNELREWFEEQHDSEIVKAVESATEQELRTIGLDSLGSIVDLIIESGLDAKIITEDELENTN